jgi:endonuclease III related protein
VGKRNARLDRSLTDIYTHLLDYYGPQHWWPADEPFEVMIGAILTQSTTWTNVEKAIRNLKEVKAISPVALRNMSASELAILIHPSGYYSVKTKKLKAFVSWLEKYSDNLSEIGAKDTGELHEELLAIYGIGEETADSIMLYAAGKPVFVIDAYTRRIIDCIGITPNGNRYADYQQLFMDNLPPDVRVFNEYHALLVRHGKTTCRKNPLCRQCCLLTICKFGISIIKKDR